MTPDALSMTPSDQPLDPSTAAAPDGVATATEPPTREPRGGGLFSPFAVRNYRLLFGGQLLSNVGDAFYAVALPWYMLTHGGPAALGLVLLAYGIPRTVFLVAGGSLADKMRPRPLMLLSDIVRTVLMAAFALLISGLILATPPFWGLLALSAGYGAFSGLFLPASSSIVPDLLPDDALQAGNSLASTSAQLSALVGPALGGLIVGFFAPWIALLADAGTFLISALSLGAMRGIRAPAAAPIEVPDAPAAPTADGVAPSAAVAAEPVTAADEPRTFWQLLRGSSLLQVMLVIAIVGNITLGGLTEVALPALVKNAFHATATEYGILLGGFAIGALLGGLSAGLLGRLPGRGIFMCVLWLGQAIAIALVPYYGLVLAGVFFGVLGLCNGSSNVFVITAIQQRMPRAMLGRVMAALMLTSGGLYPLSVAGGGYFVQAYGPALLFPLSGVIMALAVVMAISRREIRQL